MALPAQTAIRQIAAERARTDRVVEMRAELRQSIPDARNGVAQTLLHGRARALGRGADATRATAEADRSRQLQGQRIDLVAGALDAARVSECLGFFELFAQLEQATPVPLNCVRIEHAAGIAAVADPVRPPPSLTLARENVERAGLRDRIELREQGAEKLDDDQAFDLTWMPILFMPERVIPAAVERNLRALRPGGWGIFCFANFDGKDAQTAAFWRLRTTTWGGPLWIPSQVETLLRDHGFAEVRTLPSPPGVHVAFVVGRRKQG